MITLNNIHQAIEDAIHAKYETVAVYHDELPKNFTRPSFFVDKLPMTFEAMDRTATAVKREVKFCITAYVAVDNFHNSASSALNDALDALIGIFVRGYLPVGDRNPSVRLDAADVLVAEKAVLQIAVTWWEDIDDLSGVTPPEEELLRQVVLNQK